ncbi:MAG: agmatinase [Phycisphaerae bacterium]
MEQTAADTFLALPARFSDYRRSAYVILPIPYDGTASYRAGSREGPRAIIAASQQVELFDEELAGEFHRAGVATLQPLEPLAAGPEQMQQRIYRAARRVLRDGKFLIGLGGEHSISGGLVRAVRAGWRRVSVLQIDAHADLRDSYLGSSYSHAAVMRRVLEMGCGVVAVGLRSWSGAEHRLIRGGKVVALPARECLESDDWVDRAIDALGETVYVTIDIDALDPAYAPGTGTPEPGGLDFYQICSLLRLVTAEKRVVSADLVEVLPIAGQHVTEFLAARLIYKLICYHQAGRQ